VQCVGAGRQVHDAVEQAVLAGPAATHRVVALHAPHRPVVGGADAGAVGGFALRAAQPFAEGADEERAVAAQCEGLHDLDVVPETGALEKRLAPIEEIGSLPESGRLEIRARQQCDSPVERIVRRRGVELREGVRRVGRVGHQVGAGRQLDLLVDAPILAAAAGMRSLVVSHLPDVLAGGGVENPGGIGGGRPARGPFEQCDDPQPPGLLHDEPGRAQGPVAVPGDPEQ